MACRFLPSHIMPTHRGYWFLLCFFKSAACIMMNKDKDKNRMERLATAMLHTKCFLFYSFLHRERVIFKVGDEMIPGGKSRRSGRPLTSCRDE